MTNKEKLAQLIKEGSLEKSALNRAEKEYMKKFKKNNPDQVRKILGEKSIELNNLKPGQQAKMNDYIRNKVKSDVNSASRAASMSKKKLPKGVETTKKKLFGFIPAGSKKKTTYGTGSPTNSYARDGQRARLQDALKKNKRKQTFKSIATPGTAAGGLGGYLLSNKMVDDNKDHSKKKKALGTLGGAVAGNLIGKKLRGKI